MSRPGPAAAPAGGFEASTALASNPPATPRQNTYQWWFALPAIALVTFFFMLPFLANGVLSFTRWTGFSSAIRFNGLDNFERLSRLGILGNATLLTVVYALVTMAAQNTIALVLAKALQRTNRVNGYFRSLFFLPVLFSPLAAGYIWAALLAPKGPVNGAISLLVPGDFHFAWLGESSTAIVAVALIDAWKWSGLVTLVYIAGFNSISRSVIEAAILDGSGAFRRFWSIEFPLLAPAFTFNIVLTLVGSFNTLDVIFATTKGGPGNATSVLNVAVYAQYGQGLFGTSAALSFIIALLVLVTAIPLMSTLRKREVHQ